MGHPAHMLCCGILPKQGLAGVSDALGAGPLRSECVAVSSELAGSPKQSGVGAWGNPSQHQCPRTGPCPEAVPAADVLLGPVPQQEERSGSMWCWQQTACEPHGLIQK